MGNALEFSVYETKNWSNFSIKMDGCEIPLVLDSVKVFSDFSEKYMCMVELFEIEAINPNTKNCITIHADISLHGIQTFGKPVRSIKLEKDGRQHKSEMKDSCVDIFLAWCRWLVCKAIPSGIVDGFLAPTL